MTKIHNIIVILATVKGRIFNSSDHTFIITSGQIDNSLKRRFNQQIKIGPHLIGQEYPCFVIGEAGVNHNGDMALARELVDAASEAGVDAVKFQAFKTEELILSDVEKAPYQGHTTSKAESQFDMLKKLEINIDQTRELKQYAESLGLVFMTTPFDFESLEELRSLDLDALKISSTDVTNLPFLERAADLNVPIILSTGMAYLEEVDRALAILEPITRDVILLQCTANYPIENHEANLRVMNTYHDHFDMIVGYSDHSRGVGATPYAVAMGAKVVEKHFTLDRSMIGPDHAASLVPSELKAMVEEVRRVEAFLGDAEKKPTESELGTRTSLQKCIVASKVIRVGDIFSRDNLITKRTGGQGISAIQYFDVIGQASKHDYQPNDIIALE